MQDEPFFNYAARSHTPTSAPITLRPIVWGTKDRALGFAVCAHVRDATPPTVIACSIHDHALRRTLQRVGVRPNTQRDDDRIADARSAYKGVFKPT